MKTEDQLIEVCQEIGSIAGSNGHFTAGLARLLDNGGQPLLEMKVGDLLSISREYSETFNRVHGASNSALQMEATHYNPQIPERLLTDKDVAARLSCSRDHVWKLCKAGSLPKPYKLGTLTRWRQSEISKVIGNLSVSKERN